MVFTLPSNNFSSDCDVKQHPPPPPTHKKKPAGCALGAILGIVRDKNCTSGFLFTLVTGWLYRTRMLSYICISWSISLLISTNHNRANGYLASSDTIGGWNNSVDVASRYRPNGSGCESRWGGGGRDFSSLPDRPWDPPNILYDGRGVFPMVNDAGAWCWPPTPSRTEISERI
jgi:hypothetical protein